MKKFGFTLAEVLITLSIIAIAAATLAPSYLNSKPDKYKFKVVKCYNMLAEVNERLLDNPFVYSSPYLSSTGAPASDTGFTNASATGKCKYPLLAGELLKLETVSACSEGSYTGKSADSTRWQFVRDVNNSNEYIVSVTFPRNDGTECSYNATSCKYPNVFKFRVDNYGDIFAADDDKLTKTYLKNIYNIHKKEDYNAMSS